jgi:hypothetical protein
MKIPTSACRGARGPPRTMRPSAGALEPILAYAAGGRQIPAAGGAAQPRRRQRCDVDAPEALSWCSNRAEDDGTNDGGMRDDDGAPMVGLLALEPVGDPLHQAKDGLAPVWRCRGIVEPNCDGVRLACANIFEAAPTPRAVIAIAQRLLDDGIEAKRPRGVACAQFRAREPTIGTRQSTGQRRGTGLAVLVEWLVGRKRRAAHRRGRGVTNQNEARRHRNASARRAARQAPRRAASMLRTANRA